jgi:hypothetical protein
MHADAAERSHGHWVRFDPKSVPPLRTICVHPALSLLICVSPCFFFGWLAGREKAERRFARRDGVRGILQSTSWHSARPDQALDHRTRTDGEDGSRGQDWRGAGRRSLPWQTLEDRGRDDEARNGRSDAASNKSRHDPMQLSASIGAAGRFGPVGSCGWWMSGARWHRLGVLAGSGVGHDGDGGDGAERAFRESATRPHATVCLNCRRRQARPGREPAGG